MVPDRTPGMPHAPAVDACSRSPLTPPVHVRAFPYDDPCRACVYCGAVPPLGRTTPGAILTAQPGAGDADTAGTETDRGTGVPEAPGSAQAIEDLNSLHWLKWNTLARTITGCHCGFRADESSDCGFGDSVVAHLLEVGADASRPVHHREAAASLSQIAEHMPDTSSASDLRPGIQYAATLLRHTADDLTEETG